MAGRTRGALGARAPIRGVQLDFAMQTQTF